MTTELAPAPTESTTGPSLIHYACLKAPIRALCSTPTTRAAAPGSHVTCVVCIDIDESVPPDLCPITGNPCDCQEE